MKLHTHTHTLQKCGMVSGNYRYPRRCVSIETPASTSTCPILLFLVQIRILCQIFSVSMALLLKKVEKSPIILTLPF